MQLSSRTMQVSTGGRDVCTLASTLPALHLLFADFWGWTARSGYRLGLLSLLLLLSSLRLGNCICPRSCAHLSRLITTGSDGSDISTDDATLVLDSLPCTLLRNFFRKTLLMHPAVEDGPCYLAWVLALQEEPFCFVPCKAEYLGVSSHKESPLAWVDTIMREGINFDLHLG